MIKSYQFAKEVFLRLYNQSELNKILDGDQRDISYTDHQQLIRCSLGKRKCDENDFAFSWLGESQKCYKFNSGSYFNKTKRPIDLVNEFGEVNGLNLEVYIGDSQQCKSPLSISSGLSVYVHNSTYTITENDNAILVQPGTTTSIEIEPSLMKHLQSPYSDCFFEVNEESLKSSVLINKTVYFNEIYNQQYCLDLCFQDYLIEFCGCYDYSLPNYYPESKFKKEIKSLTRTLLFLINKINKRL